MSADEGARYVATRHWQHDDWTVYDERKDTYRLRGLSETEAIEQANVLNGDRPSATAGAAPVTTDAENSAIQVGVTQARNWLGLRYGDELNGRQIREIVAGVADLLLVPLKISFTTAIADDLDSAADAIAGTHDDVATALREFVAEMRTTAAAALDTEVNQRG